MAGIDSYTKLLLHMNDTGLTDSSFDPYTITKVGSVARSNTQSKFGGYSGYFSADPGYVHTQYRSELSLGTSDFTIDGWVYRTTTNHCILVTINPDPGSVASVRIEINNDGTLGVSAVATSGSGSWVLYGWVNDHTTNTVPVNQWSHFAVTRENNIWKLFIDGVKDYEQNLTHSCWPGNSGIHVGRSLYDPDSLQLIGYMDEVRISLGIARWASNFTPPTSQYSASVIRGTKTSDSRIILINESDWSIESNTVVSGSGNWEKYINSEGTMTVIAMPDASDKNAKIYKNVTPLSE